MKIRENITCPLELTHDMMRGKWKTIIIFSLREGAESLSGLQSAIRGISQKMLLQHLRELREWGMVDKVNGEGYPLQVAYYLTARGQKMLEAVKVMQQVGAEILAEAGLGG